MNRSGILVKIINTQLAASRRGIRFKGSPNTAGKQEHLMLQKANEDWVLVFRRASPSGLSSHHLYGGAL